MSYGDHRTFETVSRVSHERALVWHPGGLAEWTPAEWGNATAGEAGEMTGAVMDLLAEVAFVNKHVGELCNVLKKVKRAETGIQQAVTERTPADMQKLIDMCAQEIGDTYLYLDLVCQRLGLEMYACVRDTFNRVSDREGFPQKLGL